MSGVTDTSIFRLLQEIEAKALAIANVRRARRVRASFVATTTLPTDSASTERSSGPTGPATHEVRHEVVAQTVTHDAMTRSRSSAPTSIPWIPKEPEFEPEKTDHAPNEKVSDTYTEGTNLKSRITEGQPTAGNSRPSSDHVVEDEIGARQHKLYVLAQKIVALFGKAPFKNYFGLKD